MAVVLSISFIGNLIAGTFALWWLRLAVVLVLFAATAVLRTRQQVELRGLRVVELVVFGSVAIQLSLMLQTRMSEFTRLHDAVSLASVIHQFIAAWCVLIFLYGTLIPNTWKRAVCVTLFLAAMPYLLVFVESSRSIELKALLANNHAQAPMPLTLVAALVSTWAAHVIHEIRRQAFKAKQLGQYRLIEKIGAGGMGEVHKAEHTLLKRPCAIKLIKASSERDGVAIARFEKEVKLTAKLTHWNTVEIYDYGRTDDGTFYYVMELLPGMSLEDLVRRFGPMPPERVIYLLRQVCGALHEAHSMGLIHRDIKPANIFASERGGYYDVAKLLDFGLVKDSEERSSESAKAATFSGTPHFMPPEQVSRYDEVDGRADIYSLGAVAYCLLTGQTPFTGGNSLAIIAAHQSHEPPKPSLTNPLVHEDLDAIVVKCMAKLPANRFQNAQELMQALDNCAAASCWNSELAAQWWRSRDEVIPPDKMPTSPTEPRQHAATLDAATVDFSSE
jgi:serine/threonine-protein kinase